MTIGKLTRIHEKKFTDDKITLLADFEFFWMDGWSVTCKSKEPAIFEFSVSVMLPSSIKGVNSKPKRSCSSKSVDVNEFLFPVAHFDSPPFKLFSSKLVKEKCSCAAIKSTQLDQEQAKPLLSLYEQQHQERIRKEKEIVRKQLLESLGKYDRGHACTADSSHGSTGRRPVEADLGLITDDVLEMVFENSQLCNSSYPWKSPCGEATEGDPTAQLMSGLQKNSALAAAVLAIERHNDITRSECAPHPEAAEQSSIEAAEIAVGASTPLGNDSHVNSSVGQPASAAPSPEFIAPSVDNPFMSIDNIKRKYLQTQTDPAASQLRKRFYTDMLQDITEAALFEVAHKISRKPFKRACRAFDLFSAVMADVRPEYRGMVKGFLMADLPYMPGIHRASKYLRNRGQLVFSTSNISQESAEAKRVLGVTALAKSVVTDVQSVPPSLCDQVILTSEFDRVISPHLTATSGAESEKVQPFADTEMDCVIVDVDRCASEVDDVAEVSQTNTLSSSISRTSRRSRQSTTKKASDSDGVSQLSTFLQSELPPTDDTGSVAMLCLMADFVCSGEFAETQAVRSKAESISRGLHARWREVAARRTELVSSLAALKGTKYPDGANSEDHLLRSADDALGLPTTASKRKRNSQRARQLIQEELEREAEEDEEDDEAEEEEEEEEIGVGEEEEDGKVATQSVRGRRKLKKNDQYVDVHSLISRGRGRRDKHKKRKAAAAAVRSSKHTAPSKKERLSKKAAASLKAAGLGHRLLMTAAGGGVEESGEGEGESDDEVASDGSASLKSLCSDDEQE